MYNDTIQDISYKFFFYNFDVALSLAYRTLLSRNNKLNTHKSRSRSLRKEGNILANFFLIQGGIRKLLVKESHR